MKITIDELNQAYMKANEFKKNGYPTMSYVKVELDRNPLIHQDFFDDNEDFSTTFKLEFKLDKSLGTKGAYVCISEIDVIDDEC